MTSDDLKEDIMKIQERLDSLEKIIIERLDKLETLSQSKDVKDDSTETENASEEDDYVDNVDPYKKLTKYSYDALNQVKKDLIKALETGNRFDIAAANKKTVEIAKMVNDVIRMIERIKKQDEGKVEINNPIYPAKKLWRYFPATLRLNLHSRGATNWLGFLITGVGVLIFSRGIWDATSELFSIQGSLIIGAVIIVLMAWLERKKVFAVFGQE